MLLLLEISHKNFLLIAEKVPYSLQNGWMVPGVGIFANHSLL